HWDKLFFPDIVLEQTFNEQGHILLGRIVTLDTFLAAPPGSSPIHIDDLPGTDLYSPEPGHFLPLLTRQVAGQNSSHLLIRHGDYSALEVPVSSFDLATGA